MPPLFDNHDYIYYIDVRVSIINDNQYGELYQFDFEDNHHCVRFSPNRLKGLANINKIKLTEKNNNKIKIMLCGHFFNSSGNIAFAPRTPYASDFITIPDE
ncbi:hypothetical protein FFRU_120380 [Fructobacillus fructosus]|nr:hypothetical protein FFRU_120380 [Fructobacillus fructosus]